MRRVLALLAVAALAGACNGAAPGVSNGSVSACYRAIPVGRAALHEGKAHLIGVHRVPIDTVRDRLPAQARAELAAEDDTAVCAMAFRGTFAPGQVELAPPGDQGSYAIVLVSSRKLHLVAAVVLDHLPSSFGARTI
jgi:hypothetical protein